MSHLSKIKTLKNVFLSISLVTSSLYALSSYANIGPVPTPDFTTISIKNLVAGYGSTAISKNLMNTAPVGDDLTIAINNAQAAYLLSGSSPLVSLTQQQLIQSANLNDKNNNILAFLWDPNTKINPNLEKNPLSSIDINSLLQPISYNDTEAAAAKNVINALSGSLMPINTINFNQLIANLSGDKENNLKYELQKKQTQTYLASLRSYLATQTMALSNLYQLYAERQPIDPSKADPAVRSSLATLSGQTSGPISLLKLENIMTTRRILDKNWYKNDLINENPATLQRQQVELLAENLSESYQIRMTLERLLATMSVLVLEFNGQIRTQLQTQIQSINNPQQASG
ncbi:hypothetical protein [Rickettsiella endosymbiont of Xylota segnis]|jgi:hypothetical protein|uniref:hypothetical protein n=1 Tax=Rickettsiella endosymbiont of Xylota segnis TaxID=3066238 RepID=UPI0030CA86A4